MKTRSFLHLSKEFLTYAELLPEVMPTQRLMRIFQRSLIPDREKLWLIRSVCKRCGWEIIGGVSDGLPREELDHAARCRAKRKRQNEDQTDRW